MCIRQQEKFLSDFCINEAYATRKAWLLCRYDTSGVQSRELCIGELEQRPDRVRRNADNLEGLHGRG